MPDSACAKHARPGFPGIRFPAAAIQIRMQINSAISLAFLWRICIFYAAALGDALTEARLWSGWVDTASVTDTPAPGPGVQLLRSLAYQQLSL